MVRWRRVLGLLCVAMINLIVLLVVSTSAVAILADNDLSWPAVRGRLEGTWTLGFLEQAIHDAFWLGSCFVPALVVTITQIIFVLPLLGSRPAMSSHGKPLWSSMVMAALVAGALCVGLLFAVVELYGSFEGLIDWAFDDSVRNRLPLRLGDWLSTLWPWVFIVPSWLFWSLLLLAFARRQPSRSRWGRCIGLLLGGTVLETLIVVPLDIMARRRTSCYCGSGSFFALLISMWALLWLTGPGIVIAATSRRRRLLSETRCDACGHDKGPSPGPRCPECGHDWGRPNGDASRQAQSGK